MKANELRVGNIIGEFGIPLIVTPNIILKLYQIEVAKKICIDLHAIPLTDEWLVRFGIAHCDDGLCIKGGGMVIHNIYEGHSKIKFVHELQNRYFSLIGEEFAYTL